MTRPVRPVALVILTACALYPGLTMVFQGLYPLATGEFFTLVAERGPWLDLAARWGVPTIVPHLMKTAIGFAWLAGVPGLWAGDWRAYPLVLLAAAGSLLHPGGPMVMGAIALICLLGFREKASEVPA
jgi:hypothetical protein